jgi:WD40 repeat protein
MLLHKWRGHEGPVYSLSVAANSELFVSGGYDTTVKMWRWGTRQDMLVYALGDEAPNRDHCVICTDLSRDGKWLASCRGSAVTIWALNSKGRGSPKVKQKMKFICDISAFFSPDSKKLAVWGNFVGLVILSVDSGQEVFRKDNMRYIGPRAAWSPDSKIVASNYTDGTVRFWSAESGSEAMAPLSIASSRSLMHILFGSRANLLITSCQNWIIVSDIATGEERQRLTSQGGFRNLVLSPDDRYLAMSTNMGVELWEVFTGQRVRILQESTGGGFSLAWSRDNQYIMRGGLGGDICVWVADVQVCACVFLNMYCLCVFSCVYACF